MRLICFFLLILVVGCRGSIEDDEKDCADQLGNLASCIPFVSGGAKAPTKQCCDDTVKVRAAKPKCLCVLIKESTDPAMALPVNTTLALQMPAACNIDAKVSDCPTILKLPPGSPDAKIFAEAGSDSTSPSSSSSSSSSAPVTSSGSGSGSSPSEDKNASPGSSNGGAFRSATGAVGLAVVFFACMLA